MVVQIPYQPATTDRLSHRCDGSALHLFHEPNQPAAAAASQWGRAVDQAAADQAAVRLAPTDDAGAFSRANDGQVSSLVRLVLG